MSFPNVNESRVLLRCASNHRIEVTPRFGMNHNDPKPRKGLVLRPIIIDKLNPLSVVLLLDLLPRPFRRFQRSQSRMTNPSCVKWPSWVRISQIPACRMASIETQSVRLYRLSGRAL